MAQTTERTRRSGGYTLVELVAVLSVLSVIGMVTSGIVLSAMQVYARAVPSMDASYRVRWAAQRLQADLRSMQSPSDISVLGAGAVTFLDGDGSSIAYTLASGALTREGETLATGVTSLAFTYWDSTGSETAVAADVRLIQVDLSAQSGAETESLRVLAYPRALEDTGGGGSGEGGTVILPTPLAHWDFDETSGTTAGDSVGSNHGTFVNGVTLGATGPANGNTAASLDGSNDYVVVPHASVFLLNAGTIQLWFRISSFSTWSLVSKDSSGYDFGGHVSLYLSGDDVGVRLQSTSASYYLSAGETVSLNTWHHAAFTFGSGGMRLYVDGVLRDFDAYTGGLGTSSGSTGNTEPLTFGASQQSSGDGVVSPLAAYISGRLDEVAFYSEELSAAQVGQLYADGGAIE